MKILKLTLLSLALSLVAFAEGATIVVKEATGEAAVVNNNEVKAYEDAKNAALRTAVEQSAGVRIDADTIVVNNQLVRDQIFSNTSGYVKKYDVLEKKVEKGVASVKVKAEIITDNLDKDIQAARDLVKRMGRPSIVVVIQEQTLTGEGKAVNSSEALASALTAGFKADGWFIKDEQAINNKLSLGGAITLGPTQIKEIAELSKADFVLYGKASVRHEEAPDANRDPNGKPSPNKFYFVSGDYDLAVAATDTSEQLTKVAGVLSMSMNPKLLKQSLISYERTAFAVIDQERVEIVANVRKAVLEHFRNMQTNGVQLVLDVKGLDSFTAASDFKTALESMQGVRDVIQDKFAGGKASYRVTFLGRSADFARTVETSTFKKKKLNVTGQTSQTVEVTVK